MLCLDRCIFVTPAFGCSACLFYSLIYRLDKCMLLQLTYKNAQVQAI